MMVRELRSSWVCGVAVVALVWGAVACEDEAATGTGRNPGDNNANATPDENNDLPPVGDPIRPPGRGDRPQSVDWTPSDSPVVEERYRLEILSDAALTLNYTNEAVLEVLYVDDAGQPIRGGEVEFGFAGGGGDHMLSEAAVTTNREGVAAVVLTTGRTSGTFRIVAEAEKADPVEFTLRVQPKDNAAYVVHTHYEGVAQPFLVSVRLLDPALSCAGLDPGNLPAELHRLDVLPRPDMIPDARFIDLPNGADFTVVSLGVFDPDVPMAWGCNDMAPAIEDGFDQEVDVTMEELLPQVSGSYDIETRIDILDALPEPWRTNLHLIGEFFTDPAAALVTLMLGDPNVDDDGWIDRYLVNDLFPDSFWRNQLHGILGLLINAVLPPELRPIFEIGANLYQAVSRFTLAGYLDLDEPNEDGLLAPGQGHRYERLRLQWTVGCTPQDGPDCGQYEFGATDLSRFGFLSGTFSGQVAPYETTSYLLVDTHSFSFNYGVFLFTIFEQLIFPQIFGPGVDTVREVLESFIDCDAIADSLIDPADDPFMLNPLVYDGCQEVIGEVEGQLIDWIGGAGTGVPNLTFATFPVVNSWDVAQNGCPLYEPSPYPQGSTHRYFDRLGDAAHRCTWDANLLSGAELRPLRADFYGTREP